MNVFAKSGMRRQFIGAGIFVFFLLLVFTTGCGRKGPPVSPDLPGLPEIEDVRAQRVNAQIVLSWALPEKGEKGFEHIAGFYVYRTDAAPFGDDCEDCPRRFRQVGEVPYGEGGTDPGTWHFNDDPPPRTTVIYKIRSFRASGKPGPESETVRVPAQ